MEINVSTKVMWRKLVGWRNKMLIRRKNLYCNHYWMNAASNRWEKMDLPDALESLRILKSIYKNS